MKNEGQSTISETCIKKKIVSRVRWPATINNTQSNKAAIGKEEETKIKDKDEKESTFDCAKAKQDNYRKGL